MSEQKIPLPAGANAHHDFLEYKSVEVHFSYAFWWQANPPLDSSLFTEGFPTGGSYDRRGWTSPLLHERVISGFSNGGRVIEYPSVYQPTFVVPRRALEISDLSISKRAPKLVVSNKASLVVPLVDNASFPPADARLSRRMTLGDEIATYPVNLSWTVRLFEARMGVVTVTVSAPDLERLDPAMRFTVIHWILRLVPNTDNVPEAQGRSASHLERPVLSDAFLHLPRHGTTRLFAFSRLVRDAALANPPVASPGQTIKGEERFLAFSSRAAASLPKHDTFKHTDWRENQVPFVFITATVPSDRLPLLREKSLMRAREIGSLYARLTLDNRRPHQDVSKFDEHYLVSALGFDRNLGYIPSLGHDERLYLAFSRRGSLAITGEPGDTGIGPAGFVIPSVLNLFEIVRARLLGGLTLGAHLAERASALATLDPRKNFDHAEYADLRSLVVANLQNPLEYLFDGGAVTELAIHAQDVLFVSQAWEHVRRCFETVDRLVTTWESARLRRKYGI